MNIPTASVEAVENQRVVQRHTAIAGKSDHRSPQLTAAIQGITINPTWTIPHAIVESELIPKLKKDPRYLGRAKLVVLDRNGRKVRQIHSSRAASLLTFRQEPGSKNPLGSQAIVFALCKHQNLLVGAMQNGRIAPARVAPPSPLIRLRRSSGTPHSAH